MSLFGFAQHVGKINQGHLVNPELNRPRDRAYGYQNDFNYEDFKLGAFRNPSKGQRIRVSQAHIDRGLAKTVGEIAIMPVGINVQPDGTILVQTSAKQKNPCNPNPCNKYKMSQCDVVNDVTAKCSQHGDYELTLRWSEPDDNGMIFFIGPDYHDGTECDAYNYLGYMYAGLIGCGAIGGPSSETDHSAGVMVAETTFLLTQLDDGTKYQDLNYQVYVGYIDDNPSISEGELVISYEGEVKQVIKIPQYHGEDYVNNKGRNNYFFGCFRPFVGGYYLDTNGAGFYDADAGDVIDGLGVRDNGLCNVLLGWTGPAGYNNNEDQSGSAE